ncbi:SNF2-related protein [Streptomyces sp. SBT349]|uniref:SNF2-related protein n=1 Tax=Streptomyces sp. SBT349 TaxID=1580539 RepID=UPI00131CE790|nr:SNF2-related protein [Streptomyces sp. SBT349]
MDVAADVEQRARARTLTPNELRTLLLIPIAGPGMPTARRTALEYVAQNPPLARSILGIHAQSSGLPQPQAICRPRGAAFTAQAIVDIGGQRSESKWCTASSKKAAQQRAYVDVLEQLTSATSTPVAPADTGTGQDAYAYVDGDTLLDLLATCREGRHPELIEHVELRARSGLLTLRQIYALLLIPRSKFWRQARLAGLDAVAQTTGAAAALLDEYCRRTGLPPVRLKPSPSDKKGSYTMQALLAAHEALVASGLCSGSTEAAAAESARYELLVRLGGLAEPACLPASGGDAELITVFGGRTALEALEERARTGGISDLTCQVTGTTLPARAQAECVVHSQRLRAPGRGPTPRAAREAAARTLLLMVNRRLAQGSSPPPLPPAVEEPTGLSIPAPRHDHSGETDAAPRQLPKPPLPVAERPAPTPPAVPRQAPLRPAPVVAPAHLIAELLAAGADLALDGREGGQTTFLCVLPDRKSPDHPGEDARVVKTLLLPGGELAECTCLRVDLMDLVTHLALPAHEGWSSATTVWARVIRLALSLIARSQVYPALTEPGQHQGRQPTWRTGPWTPELWEETTALSADVARLPRCLQTRDARQEANEPLDEVRRCLDAIADRFVPAPGLCHLLGHVPFAAPVDYQDPITALQTWADDIEHDLDPQPIAEVTLRIPAPHRDQSTRLRATLRLAITPDGDETVDATDVWEGRAKLPHLPPGLRQRTGRALRRAALIFPPLGPLGQQPRPGAFLISLADAAALRGNVGDELARLGITADWHDNWAGHLAAHAVVGTGTPAPVCAGTFGLGEVLDRRWQITLDGVALTDAEMDTLAAQALPCVRLHNRWVLLDEGIREHLRQRTLPPVGAREGMLDALLGTVTFDGTTYACNAADGLAELIEEMRNEDGHHAATEPLGLSGTVLHPYQLSALNWLSRVTRLGFGAVLADDMGIGKTITALAFHLSRQHLGHGPTLVICPSSLVDNWHREIATRAPHTPVIRYAGPKRRLTGLRPDTIVITNYHLMGKDNAELAAHAWGLFIADEAQTIKNADTTTARTARTIPATTRLALTGTPIENRPDELWAILDWCNPELFSTRQGFLTRYARPLQQAGNPAHADEARTRVHQLLLPFVRRRLKTDPTLGLDLPPKRETTHTIALSREQIGLCEALHRDTFDQLRTCPNGKRRGELLLNLITSFRKVTNSPDHYAGTDPAAIAADVQAAAHRAPKLTALDTLLRNIRNNDESALVFTSYVVVGRLLCAYLTARGFRPLLFNGSLSRTQRNGVLDALSAGAADVLVMTLRSGGLGLNITDANHVIHYDRNWNPALEAQANDRVHRIGQQRPVQVHYLVTAGSIEERITSMLAKKRNLADAFLPSGDLDLSKLRETELLALCTLTPRP